MVLGASGNIGRPIVQHLLTAGFVVSALTRESSKSTFPSEVKVVRSSFTSESLTQAFRGQDAVVSTIATISTADQITAIDAMIAAGVKRFIPSEYGVDTSDPRTTELLPPAKGKVDTIKYLKTKEDKLSWTGVIVGGFFDWALSLGIMGFALRDKTVTVFDGGDHPYEATNIEQIARAVGATLSAEHYEKTSNTYIFVNSFTLTQNQVIAELEKQMNTKLKLEHASRAEVAAEARKELATGEVEYSTGSGYVKGSLGLITAEIYNVDDINNYSRTRGLWNDRLGLPKESLEETIRGVLAQIA